MLVDLVETLSDFGGLVSGEGSGWVEEAGMVIE